MPLEVSKRVVESFEDIEFAVKHGNQNCITDAVVASLQAYAAVQGAILNVKINLSGISEKSLVERVQMECKDLLSMAKNANERIQEYVNSRI